MRRHVLILSTAGLVAILFAYQQSQAPGPTLEGSEAPDFELENWYGEEVKLSDHRGKLVFLNFWATWCDGCVEEMPEMMALNELLSGRPFQMLAVSVDTSWTPIREFYESNRIYVPTLLDPGQHTRMGYNVWGFPETFLIDGEGTVVRKYIGWRNWTSPEVLSEIEEHLARVEQGSEDRSLSLGAETAF